MESRLVETLIGGAVLAIAALFFAFAYSSADVQTSNGYNLTARFDNAGGITPGTDVRLSGIKVGTVTKVALNPTTYRAEVDINITTDVELPDDSSIKVTSDGLLGGSYLAIEPGGGLDYLENGGEIVYTQGSVDLMSLIGQAVFAFTEGDAAEADSSGVGDATKPVRKPGASAAPTEAAPAKDAVTQEAPKEDPSTKDTSSEAAPTEAAPTEAAPTEAAPTEAAPTEAAPVDGAPAAEGTGAPKATGESTPDADHP